MLSDRPYRVALPVETALQGIAAGAGSKFDPGLVTVFLKLLSRLEVAA